MLQITRIDFGVSLILLYLLLDLFLAHGKQSLNQNNQHKTYENLNNTYGVGFSVVILQRGRLVQIDRPGPPFVVT